MATSALPHALRSDQNGTLIEICRPANQTNSVDLQLLERNWKYGLLSSGICCWAWQLEKLKQRNVTNGLIRWQFFKRRHFLWSFVGLNECWTNCVALSHIFANPTWKTDCHPIPPSWIIQLLWKLSDVVNAKCRGTRTVQWWHRMSIGLLDTNSWGGRLDWPVAVGAGLQQRGAQ